MCRHAAYIGPRTALAPVLTDLPHSLLKQSYFPRELLEGQTVNADGWGVAWYDGDVRPEPARLADPGPIWSHRDLPGIGSVIQAGAFVAAVRNATVAGSNVASNNAPFTDGQWSWSLNGYLSDFLARWRTMMLEEWIAPERHGRIHGTTDAEHLFQAFLTRLDQGDDARQALRSLREDVMRHAEANGLQVQLNLLAMDGEHLYALRDGNTPQSNSLYHLADGGDFVDGHVVASEPLMDDPSWEPVAPQTLMVLSAGAPPVRLGLQA